MVEMINFYGLLMLQVMIIAGVAILCISVVESITCIALALRFEVRSLESFRLSFDEKYKITAQRQNITFTESQNHWFLWLSGLIGRVGFDYLPLTVPKSYTEKAKVSTVNMGYFSAMFFLTPFYIVFSLASVFEHFFRVVLDVLAFLVFFILGNVKIFILYYFREIKILVKSNDTNANCPDEILYRKPTIEISLYKSNELSDSIQRDNLNNFGVSLKDITEGKMIRFSTIVYYPGEEKSLEKDLPLTNGYLRSTFKKLTVKTKEERA